MALNSGPIKFSQTMIRCSFCVFLILLLLYYSSVLLVQFFWQKSKFGWPCNSEVILIYWQYVDFNTCTASDSELPSYEDMVKTLEEEKQQQKMKKCESPPSYSQVVMDIEKSHRHMPDVE